MNDDVSIAVIGCGWLGLPFAKHMIASGFSIKGTTTSEEKLDSLRVAGIEPFLFTMDSANNLSSVLADSDFLVLNIPPGRRNPDALKNYSSSINSIMQHVKQAKKIKKTIFISSTSVYGFHDKVIDENIVPEPETASGKAILEAEQAIMESGSYIILRFGGLAGPGRHPGKFLAGRSGISGGHQSINYLHLIDAIKVLEHMINRDEKDQVFNVVAPAHPSKEQFYTRMASLTNLEAPIFKLSGERHNKEISADKLINQTGFSFEYPNPMEFQF